LHVFGQLMGSLYSSLPSQQSEKKVLIHVTQNNLIDNDNYLFNSFPLNKGTQSADSCFKWVTFEVGDPQSIKLSGSQESMHQLSSYLCYNYI